MQLKGKRKSSKEPQQNQLSSKYDKLRCWENVRDDIIYQLNTQGKSDETISLPTGAQVVTTLRHTQTLQCLLYIRSTTADIFVTHYNAGVIYQVSFWILQHGTRVPNVTRFSVKHLIKKMVYVPKHRVFVAYCADRMLRVFSDVSQGFCEISQTVCLDTILCLAYNKDFDEVIAGGVGCLHRFSVAEFRDHLIPKEKFSSKLSRTEWVLNVRVNNQNKTIMAECDKGVYIICYMTNSQLSYCQNNHEQSLTCTSSYPKKDFFITAARDGTIKVWNSVVFILVHEFKEHKGSITAMQTHNVEPILFSSSLDGTLRMWRLDTFELFHRIDLGESVHGLKLLNSQELTYWTERDITVTKLALFHSLLTLIQSGVQQLMPATAAGLPTQIIVSAEDGGVRFLSPVTGAIITILYPMASHQVLTNIAYNRAEDLLFAVMNSGEVLVFDTSTNPCQVQYRLVPDTTDKDVTSLAVVPLSNLGEQSACEHVVYAGHRDGTISLIHAENSHMSIPIQAHQGTVTKLQVSSTNGTVELGFLNCKTAFSHIYLVSAATDLTVKIWQVCYSKATRAVALKLVTIIPCEVLPSHLCMFGSIVCFSLMDKGVIKMYSVLHQHNHISRIGLGAAELVHDNDLDHQGKVNGIACCPALGIFASSGEDGVVKVWNSENCLVREMDFSGQLKSVCFATTRGDLFVGIDDQVRYISIQNYLPLSYLELLVDCNFQDELKEDPIPFDQKLQLWFNYASVAAFPADVTRHQREKCKPKHRILNKFLPLPNDTVARRQESIRKALEFQLPWEAHKLAAAKPLRLKRLVSQDFPAEKNNASVENSLNMTEPGLTTDPGFEEIARSGQLSPEKENLQVEDISPEKEPTDQGEHHEVILEVTSSIVAGVEMLGGGGHEAQVGENSQVQADRTKMEEHMKKFPIAPDGYIPNSVVRKVLNHKPDTSVETAKERWVLKPAPPMDSAVLEDDPSLEELKAFLSESSFDTLVTKKEPISRPVQEQEVDGKPESTAPVDKGSSLQKNDNPQYKIKSGVFKQQFPEVNSDLEQKQKGKKRKLTGMGSLSEESSNAPALLRQIVAEKWMPINVAPEVPAVTEVFLNLMDNVSSSIHDKICDYLVAIHKDTGFPPDVFQEVVDRLASEELKHVLAAVRANAARTLGELGVKEQKVIMELLPNLADQDMTVRLETAEALKKLAGIENKDSLIRLFESLGVEMPYSATNPEEDLLIALREKAANDAELAQVYERVQNWVDELNLTGYSDPVEGFPRLGEGKSQGHLSNSSRGKKGPKSRDGRLPRIKNKAAESIKKNIKYNEDDFYIDKKGRKVPKIRIPGKKKLAPSMVTNSDVTRAVSPLLLPTSPGMYNYYDRQSRMSKQSDMVPASPRTQSPAKDNPQSLEKPETNKSEAMSQGSIQMDTNQLGGSQDNMDKPEAVGLDRDSDIHSISLEPGSQLFETTNTQGTTSSSTRGSHLFLSTATLPAIEIASTGDSGFGHSVEDLGSYFIKGRSLIETGMPQALSPVKSVGEGDSFQAENWREFLEKSSRKEIEKMDVVGQKFAEGEANPGVLPPIHYLSEGVPVIPGEAGVRLLHTVSINHKGGNTCNSKRHRIDAVPGKLGVHTSNEDHGSSKYGILDMQWTTSVPCPGTSVGTPSNSGRHRKKASDLLPGSLPALRHLHDKYSSAKERTENTPALPPIENKLTSTEQKPDKKSASERYEWEDPLPPAPRHKVLVHVAPSPCSHGNQAPHSCEYMRMIKKGLHQYIPLPKGQCPSLESSTELLTDKNIQKTWNEHDEQEWTKKQMVPIPSEKNCFISDTNTFWNLQDAVLKEHTSFPSVTPKTCLLCKT